MAHSAKTLFLSLFFALFACGNAFAQYVNSYHSSQISARNDWFTAQRAYPFSADSLSVLIRRAEEKTRKISEKGATILGNYTRTSIGFGAGRMTCLAVHPTSPQTWFAGSAAGGLWKTTNAGNSWTQILNGDFSTFAIGSIAINPHRPNEILVGTGEPNFAYNNYPGFGVLRSTDGGATWAKAGAFTLSGTIAKLAFHPTDTALVFSACAGKGGFPGIYRSTNKGISWTQTLEGTTGMDIAIDVSAPNIVYSVLSHPFGSSENGVYKSTNFGLTWARLSNGLPSAGRTKITLSTTGTLFVLMANTDGGWGGLFVSVNGGASFAEIPNAPKTLFGGVNSGQGWYDIALALSSDNTRIFLGGITVNYAQMSNLNEWKSVDSLHVDQHNFAFSTAGAETIPLVANDGGIYALEQGNSSLVGIAKNSPANPETALLTTQYYAISLNGDMILGGTQDNGAQYFSAFSGAGEVKLGGDVMNSVVHPFFGTHFLVNAPNGFVYKSTTLGTSWTPSVTGIDFNESSSWVAPLIRSKANGYSNTVFTATSRVYRSTNFGDTWSAISPPLVSSGTPITALANSDQDGEIILAATQNSDIFLSKNAGFSWNSIRGDSLPNRFPSSLTIDPNNKRAFFVTYSGYGVSHVWGTTNEGFSWQNLSGNLPDIPVNCFLRKSAGNWFVGTDSGIFESADSGKTWLKISVFPGVFAPITDIKLSGEVLVCASYGSGVFALSASTIPVEIFNFFVQKKGESVELSWKTGIVRNCSHFVVERSEGEKPWQKIGEIPARNHSSEDSYAVIDANAPELRPLAYRLRAVDFDGTISIEKIAFMAEESGFYPNFSCEPNPLTEHSVIRYRVSKSNAVTLEICDQRGRIVRCLVRNDLHNSGKFQTKWDGNDANGNQVPEGIYFARLVIGSAVQSLAIGKKGGN